MPTGFDDVAFLNAPKQWPNWPVCPVKKYTGAAGSMPDCGVVLAERPTVFMVMLWELTVEKLESAVRYEYASFAELVQAGWMVD